MAKKTIRYAAHAYEISYEILNPEAVRTIVMLHGWGADKALMKQAFGKTLRAFRHVYIDLPGFGNSTVPVPLFSRDYAAIMKVFLPQIGVKDAEVIVGHSFGGKVATLLHPRLLVLLSSAGIVWPKRLKVRLKIALFKRLSKLGLSGLRNRFAAKDAQALSCEMYTTFKNVVDEDFSDVFRRYKGRALLCWGETDTATPLRSAEKIAALIEQCRLVVLPGDHYFFLTQADAVAEMILADLEGLYDDA